MLTHKKIEQGYIYAVSVFLNVILQIIPLEKISGSNF